MGSKWKRRCILYALAFGILFVSFMYVDTKSIVCYQVTFGETLLDGNLINFYNASVQNVNYYTELGIGVKELGFGMCSAIWDFILYIILGIWGLPLTLIKRIFHIDPMQSILCMLYAKSIYIIALIILCKALCKICNTLGLNKEKSYLCIGLFLNSLFLYTAVCINGQADILGIIFVILGINFYLDNKILGFVIAFTIAVSCKSMAFFIFLPCLLLKEKNLFKILCFSLCTLILTISNDLIFAPFNAIGIGQKKEIMQIIYDNLLYYKLPMFNASVPILLVLWGLVCAFCYLREMKAFKQIDVIYISALVMGIILIFYNSSAPYRYIWIVPFLVILETFFYHKCYYLILFETIAVCCLTLGNYIEYWWCFEIFNTSGTLLSKVLGTDIMQIENPVTLQRLFMGFRNRSMEGFFYAVFIVCITAFFIICYFQKNGEPCNKQKEFRGIFSESLPEAAVKRLIFGRAIIYLGIAYIPFTLCVINILFKG